MKHIICAGQANVDVVATPFEGFSENGDVTYADQIKMTTGGDAMNTSVRLRNLGMSVAFAGAIGKDAAGDFLYQNMYGMNTDGLLRTDESQTAVCMALVQGNGQRRFIYNPGSNGLLSASQITDHLLAGASILHVGGVMQMSRLEPDLHTLFQAAHRHGVLTSMDVTYDLDGLWLKKIEKALPYTDYFLPSIEEVSEMTGYQEPEQIRRFFEGCGMKGMVIKLGKRGCYVTDFREERYLSEYPAKVVDTTGAGDSFVGGFLAAISQGENCFTAASVGTVVASVCVAHVGATGGCITYSEAKKLAASYFEL